MEEQEIEYENSITAEDYLRLRESVGWHTMAYEQAENAVKTCFYSVCAKYKGRTIGMVRLVWNGEFCACLSDVIVEEKYRSRGIATHMVNMVIEHLKKSMKDGWSVKLFLLAAKDRESFYERLGFESRPNDHSGSALDMVIEK